MEHLYTGINIQWPISRLILDKSKSIETRTYPLPEKLFDKELVLIETPGKRGVFQARSIAIIKFTGCIHYKSKEEFYFDTDLHHVTPDSDWAWKDEKPKWGWIVEVIRIIDPPKECSQKGIVYRSNIQV